MRQSHVRVTNAVDQDRIVGQYLEVFLYDALSFQMKQSFVNFEAKERFETSGQLQMADGSYESVLF